MNLSLLRRSNETVGVTGIVVILSRDLTSRVDRVDESIVQNVYRRPRARIGVIADAAQDKAVEEPVFIHVPSRDFAAIVDSFRHGTGRSCWQRRYAGWRIELRVELREISRSIPENAMTNAVVRGWGRRAHVNV